MVTFDAVGPSSAGAGSTSSTTLSWSHTCAASATVLYVGVALGTGSDTGFDMTVTYDGVAMTLVGSKVHSAGGTTGFLEVFKLDNPHTGSALTVAVTATGGTPGTLSGGSQSYIGTTGTGSPVTNTRVGVGSLSATVNGTTTGNLVAAFLACGTNGSTSTAPANSRFQQAQNNLTAAGNSGGEDQAAGGNVTIGFSAADDSAIIAFEIQGAAAAGPAAARQSYAPAWHPGRGLPGLPGGTPFWAPVPSFGTTASVAAPAVAAVQPPRLPRTVRSRARLGGRGLCAAGIAVAAVAISPAPHERPAAPRHAAPVRASIGPQGRNAAGIASQIFATRGTPARPQPFVARSPLPHRAVVRGGAVTVLMPAPGPLHRPLPPRRTPARVTWRGGAGPQPATVVAAPQAYQHSPPPTRRAAPFRAVIRRNAGLVNAAPATQAAPRPLPQPRSKPRRVLWRGGAGPQPAAVAVTPPPKSRPLLPRRKPARVVWRYVRGLVNLTPPPFTIGQLTATDTAQAQLTATGSSATLTATGTTSSLTASDTSAGTMTASDTRGGPGG